MSTLAAVLGRILLAVIFIVAGVSKLIDPAGTEAAIVSTGMPSGLALPAGGFEVIAGAALALGVMTRLTAVLLAGFTALVTLLFHNQLTDPMQQALALKNLAIIGGLLLVFAHSQMWWSWDRMRRARKGELTTIEAQRAAHEAELRAARAEGMAEAARMAPVAAAPVAAAVPVAPVNPAVPVTHVDPATTTTVTDVDGDGVPEVRRKRRWF